MGHLNYHKMKDAAEVLSDAAGNLMILQGQLEDQIQMICNTDPELGSVQGEQGEAGRSVLSANAEQYQAIQSLKEDSEVLFREAEALRKASEALLRSVRIYKRADGRAADIYAGEYRIVPRTEFGVSLFGNLSDFDALIPVADATSGEEEMGFSNISRGRDGEALMDFDGRIS